METNEQLKEWIYTYDKKLREQLSLIDHSKKCYLSADEGGMMGNPKFSISTEEVEKPYFEFIGYLNRHHIHSYILGRMLTWKIENGDYSETVQIIIE